MSTIILTELYHVRDELSKQQLMTSSYDNYKLEFVIMQVGWSVEIHKLNIVEAYSIMLGPG